MSDQKLEERATRAGVAVSWRDQTGADRKVSPDSLRAILNALGENDDNGTVRFAAGRVAEAIDLPFDGPVPKTVEVLLESGATCVLSPIEGPAGRLVLPGLATPGYHRLNLPGADWTIAVAPKTCVTFAGLNAGVPGWGLAAQVYALRADDDCGIGDFAGVAALSRTAGRLGADFLAISPVHALFGAAPERYSPYSPSTRLFHNPLYANPGMIFPDDLVRRAIRQTGLGAQMQLMSQAALIDWPAAQKVKRALLRALFALMREAGASVAGDFFAFRDGASRRLQDFALFEALHAAQYGGDAGRFGWRGWSPGLQGPGGADARTFAVAHTEDIDFQIFLQWLVASCYGAAQDACRDAGMKVGLIADLAIGVDPDGAHAWAHPDEVLRGLTIGAPPDYYAADGQNWALTGFSPLGLQRSGFAPFIETLRANLRHSGGLRIDHVMGMNRLWLIPEGGAALDGAYVDYPSQTLFRLTALESWRHRAIIIGEDLGTLPTGFADALAAQGVAGMCVLRFERDAHGFKAPDAWSPQAAALTSTHDMIATAGWWKGADLRDEPERERVEDIRAWDRGLLWAAFQQAGIAFGERPAPEDATPVVDAALEFVARTPCAMKLIPLEDALASDIQPNVPGTTVEKPNWRHRFRTPSGELLDDPAVRARLARLGSQRSSSESQ